MHPKCDINGCSENATTLCDASGCSNNVCTMHTETVTDKNNKTILVCQYCYKKGKY
jgi:hypothetical protein